MSMWNSMEFLSSSVINFLPPFSPVSTIFQVASVPLEMLVRQGHQVANIEGEHAVLEPLTGLGSHWEPLGAGFGVNVWDVWSKNLRDV